MCSRPLIILLIIVSLCICILVFHTRRCDKEGEPEKAPSYFRISEMLDLKHSKPLMQVYQEVLGCIQPAPQLGQADYVFFETFNRVDQIMMALRSVLPEKSIINGMNGTDLLVSKATLAQVMRGSPYTPPETFVLGHDMKRFIEHAYTEPETYFILKKNVQRQQGLFIGRALEALARAQTDPEYVVAQRMLDDPFLIGGRKINMRVYLVVVIEPGKDPEWHVYDDGFIYYTPLPYLDQGRVTEDTVITSGYIDRKIYAENPLSVKDLLASLPEDQRRRLTHNIKSAFADLARRYTPLLKRANRGIPGTKFSIFGCDLAPSNQLDVVFMEINKGPDLGYKDERDRGVKLRLVQMLMDNLSTRRFTRHHKKC